MIEHLYILPEPSKLRSNSMVGSMISGPQLESSQSRNVILSVTRNSALCYWHTSNYRTMFSDNPFVIVDITPILQKIITSEVLSTEKNHIQIFRHVKYPASMSE